MASSDPHLAALIRLLGDDHSSVIETVRRKLIDLGAKAVPSLEKAASKEKDPKVRLEARALLERIRLMALRTEWEATALLPDPQLDLEKATFLLTRVSYPDVDLKLYQMRLDELAHRIRPNLKAGSKQRDQLAVMNRFLFQDEKFRGNWTDYFDPQNSYLNRVLDRKLGIPISLSVLYLLVGKRLGLSIEGVGIPGHFMVKSEEGGQELYVDTFNEGRLLSRSQCIEFMVDAGYPYQTAFLQGVGPRDIVGRMIRNLILIYADREEEMLEQIFTSFLEALYPMEKDQGSMGTEAT